jgi:DNA polymerase-3 subunit delta
MTVTLTGPNTFGLQAELRAKIAAFVAEQGDLALERIDGEEATADRITEALTSPPFLANKKLVVLMTPGANKQFAENVEQILTGAPETTEVILVEPKLDKRLAYYKYLKKTTDFRDFPELDQNDLSKWLMQATKERGGSISLADARYLVERVGTNQQLLANELDKLALQSTNISRDTINVLTDPLPQSTVFELLEAAFGGNQKRALDLYAQQRALKVEPQQIIAMLAWQLHVLAVIKTGGDRSVDQIAKEAKLNPFVVRKSQGIARKISLPELKILISDLLRIDMRSKRTAIDLDEALQHYLLAL